MVSARSFERPALGVLVGVVGDLSTDSSSMLKRAHKGTYHKMNKKHLNRCVNEFLVRHNIREKATIDQLKVLVTGMVGRRIMYKDLVSGVDGRLY